MLHGRRVVVVCPAYRAEKTLESMLPGHSARCRRPGAARRRRERRRHARDCRATGTPHGPPCDQRRLRREPEDLLYRGAARRRRHRRHGAPGLPVRAAARSPHWRRWSRPASTTLRSDRGCSARRRSPAGCRATSTCRTVTHRLPEPDDRRAAVGISHRLSRFLAPRHRRRCRWVPTRTISYSTIRCWCRRWRSTCASAKYRVRPATSKRRARSVFARSVVYGLGVLRTSVEYRLWRLGARIAAYFLRGREWKLAHPAIVAQARA